MAEEKEKKVDKTEGDAGTQEQSTKSEATAKASTANAPAAPAAPKEPEPVFNSPNDYVLALKVLRALKKYMAEGKKRNLYKNELAEYLAANDDNAAGLSPEQISRGFDNIQAMSGGKELWTAANSLTEPKVKEDYERFKQFQREKMTILGENIGPARNDTKIAKKELNKSKNAITAARFGRAGIVLGGIAIGAGYIGGAITLAGGLAALATVPAMGLLTVAAIGGVVLYQIGKRLLPWAFKKLGNIIQRHKDRVKGNDKEKIPSIQNEYNKRLQYQRSLENQYNNHYQNLRNAEMYSDDALFNSIVGSEAERLMQRDAVGTSVVAAANAANTRQAASNIQAAAPIVQPAAIDDLEHDYSSRRSHEASIEEARAANPADYNSSTYNVNPAPSTTISAYNSDSYNTNIQQADEVYDEQQTTMSAGYDNTNVYNVENNNYSTSRRLKPGVNYTYPVERPTQQQYNLSEVAAQQSRETAVKNVDVATFVKMALRMDLEDAMRPQEIMSGNDGIVQDKNNTLLDKGVNLSKAEVESCARKILSEYCKFDEKDQDRMLQGSNNKFLQRVEKEATALRQVVYNIQAAKRDAATKINSGYSETQFVQDVIEGKITLAGASEKTLKQEVGEYLTADALRNGLELRLPGTEAKQYDRIEILTMTNDLPEGQYNVPIDPRAIARLGSCVGLSKLYTNDLSDKPEYEFGLTQEQQEEAQESFGRGSFESSSDVANAMQSEGLAEAKRVRDNINSRLVNLVKALKVFSSSEENKAFFEALSQIDLNENESQGFDKAALVSKVTSVLNKGVDEEKVNQYLQALSPENKELVTGDTLALFALVGKFVTKIADSDLSTMSSEEVRAKVESLKGLQQDSQYNIRNLYETLSNDPNADLMVCLQQFISSDYPNFFRCAQAVGMATNKNAISVRVGQGADVIQAFAGGKLNPETAVTNIADIAWNCYQLADGIEKDSSQKQAENAAPSVALVSVDDLKKVDETLYGKQNVANNESKNTKSATKEAASKANNQKAAGELASQEDSDSLIKTIKEAFVKVFGEEVGKAITDKEVTHAYNEYCYANKDMKIKRTKDNKPYRCVTGTENSSFALLYNGGTFAIPKSTYNKLGFGEWEQIARNYAKHLSSEKGKNWATGVFKYRTTSIMSEAELKARLDAAKAMQASLKNQEEMGME